MVRVARAMVYALVRQTNKLHGTFPPSGHVVSNNMLPVGVGESWMSNTWLRQFHVFYEALECHLFLELYTICGRTFRACFYFIHDVSVAGHYTAGPSPHIHKHIHTPYSINHINIQRRNDGDSEFNQIIRASSGVSVQFSNKCCTHKSRNVHKLRADKCAILMRSVYIEHINWDDVQRIPKLWMI